MSLRRRPAATLTAALPAGLVIGLLAGACGTSELDVEPTFDGVWIVAELTVGGESVDLDGPEAADLVVEIDTGEAALRGRTGCGRFFGSYTLSGADEQPDGPGSASFTVPSPQPTADCVGADRAAHTALVDGLETVTQWRRDEDSLLLEDPPETTLELRPAG